MEIYKGSVLLPVLEREPYGLGQSNVLISRDGRASLGDLGFARVEEV